MDAILSEADPDKLIILFPSEGSISTEEYAREAQKCFDQGITVSKFQRPFASTALSIFSTRISR